MADHQVIRTAMEQALTNFWSRFDASGVADLKKFCDGFNDEHIPRKFLDEFIIKVEDVNNPMSPKSTMISHFAAEKKRMKRRVSKKKYKVRKAIAAKEIEEIQRQDAEKKAEQLLLPHIELTDQEIQHNLEKLRDKKLAEDKAYEKSRALRAADNKLSKKAGTKLNSRLNFCNEYKGINIEKALHGDKKSDCEQGSMKPSKGKCVVVKDPSKPQVQPPEGNNTEGGAETNGAAEDKKPQEGGAETNGPSSTNEAAEDKKPQGQA